PAPLRTVREDFPAHGSSNRPGDRLTESADRKCPSCGGLTVTFDYDWASRKKLSDAELAAPLDDPRLQGPVLLGAGDPAGFAELDRRVEGEIELVQFGLMPEFIGQGLGRYFLQWTIERAWSYGPRRFWLHTCTKDHPAALPNYLKAGFAVYKEEVKDQG